MCLHECIFVIRCKRSGAFKTGREMHSDSADTQIKQSARASDGLDMKTSTLS